MEKTHASLAELKNLSSDIPEPTNFFDGVDIRSRTVPRTANLFTRQDLTSGHAIFQHHHCVLIVPLEGAGGVCVDDQSIFLEPGEGLLIFPFQFHSYTQMPKKGVYWLFVQFDAPSTEELQFLHHTPVILGQLELRLLQEMLLCWKNEKQRSLVGAHLSLLLCRLAVARKKKKKDKAPNSDETAELLTKINGFLLPRLDQPIGLKQVAKAVGLSESHLRARFRSVYGLSLGWHLRRLRLRRAQGLLYITRLPIKEIADRSGFESIYSFSRAFKSIHGISPRAYREQNGTEVGKRRPKAAKTTRS